jgi:ribosomal protein L34
MIRTMTINFKMFGPLFKKVTHYVCLYVNKYQRTSITIDYHLNGQLMSSLLIFKCTTSHGTMKSTLKPHVCYFVLIVGVLPVCYLCSLHPDFDTSENLVSEYSVTFEWPINTVRNNHYGFRLRLLTTIFRLVIKLKSKWS